MSKLNPLPPLAEQHRIFARINAIFSLLDTIDTLQTQYLANMTILHSKLIDVAIQEAADGTAEELYEQIQAEKDALAAVERIKKINPLLPVEADEVPFEVLESWKWVSVGDV